MAHELWERGLGDHGTLEEPIAWEDLSNQDKLDIVDGYMKGVVMNMAKAYLRRKEVEEGNIEVDEAVASTHDLG